MNQITFEWIKLNFLKMITVNELKTFSLNISDLNKLKNKSKKGQVKCFILVNKFILYLCIINVSVNFLTKNFKKNACNL